MPYLRLNSCAAEDGILTDTNQNLARNFGLDAVRATAILLVLIADGAQFIASTISGFGLNPADLSWPPGFADVELFFCLSGYLIGRILLEIGRRGASLGDVRRFLVRRWLRTLPLYFLVLAALCFFRKLDPSARADVWSYAFLVQNVFKPMPAGNWFGTSWSLTIEEWSYVLLPSLAFFALLRLKNAVLWSALLLCLIAIILRAGHPSAALEWDTSIRKLAETRADALAYGVIFAWAYQWFPEATKEWSRRLMPVSAAIIIFSVWLISDQTRLHGVYARVFLLPVFSIAVLGLFPLIIAMQKPVRSISAPVSYVARISYSLSRSLVCNVPGDVCAGAAPFSILYILVFCSRYNS